GIDMPQIAESADHQPGGDEQDESKRNLRDDKKIPEAMAIFAVAHRAPTAVERIGDLRPCVTEDRNHAKKRAEAYRNDQSKQHYPDIDMDVMDAGKMDQIGRRE